MAKREPAYVPYSLLVNLTEMFPKNNSQKNKKMQHAYSNEVYVKCQYLSKRIFWQHHVLGKWNICTLEIAIGDDDEYVLTFGQLDSV